MPRLKKQRVRTRLGLNHDGFNKPSPMGIFCKSMLAKGRFHARDVAMAASASASSMPGRSSRDVQALARALPTKWLVKRGRHVPDTRNTYKQIRRELLKSSWMPDTYIAEVPMFCNVTLQSRMLPMSFLLIHEVLDNLIKPGEEELWASYGPDQLGFGSAMKTWQTRTNVEPHLPCLGLGVWGDGAKYSNKDSVLMWLFTTLSGPHQRRFWLCTVTKKCMPMRLQREVHIPGYHGHSVVDVSHPFDRRIPNSRSSRTHGFGTHFFQTSSFQAGNQISIKSTNRNLFTRNLLKFYSAAIEFQ